MPSTPPVKDIPELQIRTFSKLRKNDIRPVADSSLKVVACAGNSEDGIENINNLKNDLLQILLASYPATNRCSPKPQSKLSNGSSTKSAGLGIASSGVQYLESTTDFGAKFLSITLSQEPPSLLVEQRLLPHLTSTLLGSTFEDDMLVPITLDLQSLGWDATGIVGGVAGRLSQGPTSLDKDLDFKDDYMSAIEGTDQRGAIDISFLSTAKAGTVIVKASQLDQAMKAMEVGMDEVQRRL